MNSRFFFLIVVAWLGGIMLVSLLYGTSGIRESMQTAMAGSFDSERLASMTEGMPSGSNMSMLSENHVSADCCPSTYTTSNGCVCLTQDQLEQINTRGGNRLAY
jgi:hypothetical protein